MPQSQPVRLLLLAVAFIGLAPVLAAAAPGEPGAPGQPPGPVRLGDVGAGSLLFRTEAEGLYLPAPLVRTDVRMDTSGMINRVTVSQRFYNPTDKWLEAVYVFPLPEGAAVDHLRLRVGERLIEGKIKEREEAKKIYARAKAEGRKASLIEQERPNIFTNSVANIGPGEDVVVQIEYQESLRYDRGGFSLRFPMVVGPRFIPGSAPLSLVSTGTGWAANNGRVPDADRITPPVLHPSRGKTNPVTIEIALDPGFAIARIASPSHKIVVREDGAGGRIITLDAGPVPADRDFVLEWLPETGTAPSAGLFTETAAGTDYALIMLMPPVGARQPGFDLPREVIYVIDTSGSMGGASIRQAREALLLALSRLRPRDSFNVIQFNDITSALFPQARRAGNTAVEAARRYVRNLAAEGGTDMLPALVRALDTGGAEEAGRLRQVIFLTDGAIGNEVELFREVKARLGRSRLFTVGIGSAPNSYFMTRAARYGHGTFTHIGDLAEVKERMTALFAKLEAPVLTDIAVDFPDQPGAETWPRIIPDLYQGEPVVVAARLPAPEVAGGGRAVITGLAGGQPWRVEMQLGIGRAGQGVGALWARRKIAALMEKLHEGASPDEVKPRVVEVALAHHLVSRYTSLVAVDVRRSRPAGEDIETGAVATNLPHGWDYDKVFGAPTGPRRQWQMKRKARAPGAAPVFASAAPAADLMVALKTAAAPAAAGANAPGQVLQQLPKGATPALLKLLIGLAALLLAAFAASWPRWPRMWRARRRSFS